MTSTRSRDFYRDLGVARDASQDDIQRAYRKLAREYHPDVNHDPGAEEKFKDISEAYDALRDPDTRRKYDAYGPDFRQVPEGVDPGTWQRARAGAGARSGGGGAGAGGAGAGWSYGGDDVDLEELFGGMFGGGFSGFGGGRGGRRARGPIPGADQEAEIVLSVEDAYRGGRRTLTLSGPDGPRTLEVNIPAGVTDGQRIRLAGQGGRGSDGAEAGDLYLVVRLADHPRYRVEGRDVHVDLPVAPWEAVLGAKVPLDTPGGTTTVTVPAGTSSGKRLRLRGRGLPNPRGKPGDLYAEVRIVVPDRVTDEERGLWEQLASTSTFDPRRS
ncbi:MAG TPA: J domain-containing protein [Mycobacteriales bacterium]|nr:J domain-containing protein [Mycobacteriales bacterium]